MNTEMQQISQSAVATNASKTERVIRLKNKAFFQEFEVEICARILIKRKGILRTKEVVQLVDKSKAWDEE